MDYVEKGTNSFMIHIYAVGLWNLRKVLHFEVMRLAEDWNISVTRKVRGHISLALMHSLLRKQDRILPSLLSCLIFGSKKPNSFKFGTSNLTKKNYDTHQHFSIGLTVLKKKFKKRLGKLDAKLSFKMDIWWMDIWWMHI